VNLGADQVLAKTPFISNTHSESFQRTTMSASPATQRLYSTGTQDPAVGSRRANPSSRARKATADSLFLATMDFVLVWLSAGVALGVRVDTGAINYGASLEKNAGFLVLLSILVVLFCHVQKLYEHHPRSAFDEGIGVSKAVGSATIVLSASIYLSGQKVVSRLALGITVLLAVTLLVSWRHLRRRRIMQRVEAGQDCQNVLIFGWGQRAEFLERHFIAHRLPGYVIKGFLDRRRRPARAPNIGSPERRSASGKAIGTRNELCDVVRANFIDEILVFLPEDREMVKELIVQTRELGISLRVVPDSYDGLALGAPIEYMGPFPAIQMHEKPIPTIPLILKRCMDVIGSGFALLLGLPLSCLIALAIRIDSPGAILYRSERIGRKGRTFTCYKFRTMVQNADALKDRLRELNERDGVLFKIAKDPRVTPVGRFLRRYSLDEIPQFWNVFNGDMSLVGPRPPIPGEYRQYELDDLKRLHVSPGITGLWQVEARTDPSFESYINLDKHYVENWSMWLDLKILVKTVAVVVTGTGQ
jgi:exopolysaccharide biosynthesis polyprenyl glycosylphosphotransferase